MKTRMYGSRAMVFQVGLLVLAVWIALGAAQPVGAQTDSAAQASDPASVVDTFHAAGDDMEAALSLLTNDVVIELIPPPPNTTGVWKGKEGARAFFEWRNAQNIRRVRVGTANVSGNTIEGNVSVTSNTFKRLGLGAVAHIFRAEVQDGKLKYYFGQLAPFEQERVSAALLGAGQAQAQPAGMPRTGESGMLPLITALGVLMLAVGAGLRRRTA